MGYRLKKFNGSKGFTRETFFKMKYLRLIILLPALAGCASLKYDGPGTVQDFATARTECYSALRGTADDAPTVNCGAWTACLTSKGYVRDRYGQFDVEELGMTISCSD